MRSTTRIPARCTLALVALACLGAQAAPQAHANLGRGLRELVEQQALQGGDLARPAAREALAGALARAHVVAPQLDAEGRVLVVVHLDGRRALAEVRERARGLGGRTLAEAPAWRHGAFSAWLPVARAQALAEAPGVRAVLLAPKPVFYAGKAQSQGVAMMHADAAAAQGWTGAGITVGAMSDSYDANAGFRPLTYPGVDIKSGDLPGTGNPDGYTLPVVDVHEYAGGGEDEGRAMLQIVHDVAPGARLCFSTAYPSEFDFAATIAALADKASGLCGADILVDDVGFIAEPMFQDGVVAQAVDQVVAQGVSYFSSAGNQPAANGYAATWAPVDDATARATTTSVNMSQIPAGMTPGGFHNFAAATGGTDIVQRVFLDATGNNYISLQWNDPFDSADVQTDYDLWMFDDAGNLVGEAIDQNSATGEPVEIGILGPGWYRLVIARADTHPGAPSAPELRYVVFGDVGQSAYAGKSTPAPTLFGHAAADGAIAVAATSFYEPYVNEPFTSNGPTTFWFDKDGTRLATPVVRNKPEIAAPDGVNTTFFPPMQGPKRIVAADSAEDADGFANFFGTSAAAPHAAAVGALLMQKAGGRAHLAPARMKQILEQSAQPHDPRPGYIEASAKVAKATVRVQAVGQGFSGSAYDPDAFTVTLGGPKGVTLQSLTLDLSTANAPRLRLGQPAPGLVFDPVPANFGFPLTWGALTGVSAADVTASPLATAAPFSDTLTLGFAAGKFGPGASLGFGVGRDELASGERGDAADLLQGGRISGTVLDAKGKPHAFSAVFDNGAAAATWTPVGGYGLVDAQKALSLVQAPAP